MSLWLGRIRGALGMGVTWAVAWALVGVLIGVGTLLGVPMDWFIEVFDAPLPALAVPGFFSGAAFSLVLGVAGRRRRFDELSLPRFATWGALGGLLLSSGPVVVALSGGTLGAASAGVAVGTIMLLSAASAVGSLALARTTEDRALLDTGEEVAEVGLDETEARDLLGGAAHPEACLGSDPTTGLESVPGVGPSLARDLRDPGHGDVAESTRGGDE